MIDSIYLMALIKSIPDFYRSVDFLLPSNDRSQKVATGKGCKNGRSKICVIS